MRLKNGKCNVDNKIIENINEVYKEEFVLYDSGVGQRSFASAYFVTQMQLISRIVYVLGIHIIFKQKWSRMIVSMSLFRHFRRFYE